ncbi:GNAT family N-acetyltransferase [Halalkalibacter urbisdiaboli]|uniref:GNAT family N-acetyltransferase n=1 Tax=Halalkalibacter urbisdiaboli TaxID=1960589 RepID=UPI0013FD8A17|nr:GNAT family N-acetyltransferase [Halalkalibacter urbisdiaboli]
MKINRANVEQYRVISELYHDLINEIGQKTKTKQKLPKISDSLELCKKLLEDESYIVFLAEEDNQIIGFISLCPSRSLYAGGEFGIIQEFFVRPSYRSKKVGTQLLAAVSNFSRIMKWKRVEVATPPIPQFARSYMFYQSHGFVDCEGRKMKLLIK